MLSFRYIAALTFLFLTSACGFQPLYGVHENHVETRNELAKIKILTIADRLGQQVHNYLLDRITPLGSPVTPAYMLGVKLNLSKQELGVGSDETTTRAKLVLSASFHLQDKHTGKNMFQSDTQSTNSYTIVKSEFANLSAEVDAIDRAAREVSESIRSRLALYFATRSVP